MMEALAGLWLGREGGGASPCRCKFFSSCSCLLRLLFVTHHLELVDLLQLGDLEGAVGLAGLHFEVVDLHVPLFDGILHVELLPKHGAALVVQLFYKSSQVVLAHGRNVG